MHWLLYLPAIAAPIAVIAAYGLLRLSAKQLRARVSVATPSASQASAVTSIAF